MKEISIYQQTRALLHKNLLTKWRMKRESFLEWSIPIIIGLYMGLFSYFKENMQFPEIPSQDLGSVDEFNGSSIMVVYTPISNITQLIMNKTTFAPSMKGTRIIGVPSKTELDEVLLNNIPHALGIIFNDTFSYKLEVFLMYGNPFLKEDLLAHCWDIYGDVSCSLSRYWKKGFVPLQTAINAAIIEITTNHSVMEELMSVNAITMKTLPFITKDVFQYEFFILFCLLYFSSFVYFVSRNVTKERKKYKELMKIMGLQDSAFWLSWGLIYVGFIFIISIFIAIIITSAQIIVMTGFLVIFTLFFLYGLSLIAVAFLMAVLLQKAILTNLIVFLFTLLWGCVGFTVLHKQLPTSLQWILSICSPFTFTSGMAKIISLEYNLNGVVFPDPSGESYVILVTFFILAFDALIYLVLALYFDKILLYGDERRYSLLFFLNSSSCFRQKTSSNQVIDRDIDHELPSDDYFEPVAPEYQGKEAIRIRNVKKEYKGKSGKVEALKGLFFDIYESQITAILGHSGAGKSSLLNILNGLYVPTSGLVTVYNKNLSEMKDLEEIRKITGICPQHNVQFDALTVKENLTLFAKIKGILPQTVKQEVQQIILELDMQNIQDNLAEHLSEGQKRKLTFGIATLGDPRILLLDEPTVGLDPFSRLRVWSFLKERKANRVILFSTQFMDEADILADRKVIISNGTLKCTGSSVFLKRKWGLGYHLSLFMDETCDSEQITSFINHHIPDAKLKAKTKEKLVYILPLERTSKFPDFFRDLDNYSGLGLMNYEVSMSTLNEVFMNMEGESTTKQNFEKRETRRDTEIFHEMEPPYSSLSEVQRTVSPMRLWAMQVCAIARLRILKLKRERKAFLTFLLILGIALFPLTMEKIANAVIEHKNEWEFKTELYFLSPGQLPEGLRTSLLVINNTESNIEDFIQSLKHQNIVLEVDDFGNRNGTESLSYNGAVIVSGRQKDYRFSVVCNTKRLHCFPILMNVLSNGILHMFNHTQHIRIEETVFSSDLIMFWFGILESFLFLLLVACSISPHIAMSSVSDYKKKADSQLWISGLYPSAYWCGQAVVDINLFNVILLSSYFTLHVTKLMHIYLTSEIVLSMVVLLFGCAASLVFLTYVISFAFGKRRKNSGLWSVCFFTVLSIMFKIIWTELFSEKLLITIMVLVPSFSLTAFPIVLEMRAYQHYREFGEIKYGLSGVDLLLCLIPYFHTLLFIFVLRCLELKCGKNVIRKDPIFRISPRSLKVQPNPEEHIGEDEDEDVQAERIRTSAALSTSDLNESPVIIANSLHKEYPGQKKSCFSKRTKKVVARNISFCVNKGEILGLLGPNGAGKTSSVRMIAGITKPAAGEVELKGFSSAVGYQGDGTVKFGYCPQENVLWPILTVKEHLEVYAAVKGLRKEDAAIAISRLVNAFKLHSQLDVLVQKLAAGATRKLCFVLSILGDSSVLILDEPSTGLDVSEQQQVWQAIQAAVKENERGVLLATHNLAEAEALCDRVAIMVSGRLRCIGSVQHLKRKFGKDYILELKVNETSQVPEVHREIVKLFPQASRQERYFSLLTYQLPVTDVYPLSQAFHKLEAVKCSFNLEEYSLSQCTLDRVFLELSKDQELENVHEEADTTVRWKLLPRLDEL
ncbi:ATP-binding cassette sub-family A member 6 [Phodopus roborovskii]|uniref:Abca6 protein n=1 Tax=Phodopus roborovskii TaxID=109678 RepID=A0AAU9YP43_PHORO|nr:ATP-binding cassette sub-family A member 6 [Phodopus roborovskii]XP_051035658.1 ATP-binding cassette sub-family A member 6 [Phodopus roborovskii]CAH6776357.1 Abca6 [Phodopus roborovskii]